MKLREPIKCFCIECQSDFLRYRNRGRMDVCTQCSNKKRLAEWVRNNPDRKRENNKMWALANPDKDRESKDKWQKMNPENGRQKQRLRGTRVRRATPKWACKSEILKMYKIATRLSAVTGIEHHVDHVIPLKGETVCGLHVQGNLRVISGSQNKSKGNRFEGNA